ncbi:MAG: TIGR01777 family protein [Bacteroidales bacterium]|nr:TIGR01777 family protein [Bacteroidales bacterium]
MKNILITGGTGLIGSELQKLLKEKGYETAVLSRSRNKTNNRTFYWDYENGILDEEALVFADAIIHLAGENISAGRWTPEQKKQILDSRLKTTQLLVDKIRASEKKPEVFISASAVGYYGSTSLNWSFHEENAAGKGFLAKVTEQWEQSSLLLIAFGIRRVVLRTGVVLSEKGGALTKMMAPVKLGLGAPLGSGKQMISWISLQDLAGLYVFALENQKISGEYNAVAPTPLDNRTFMKTLAHHMHRPFFLPPVPAFVMKAMYGEMASIVLEGQGVSADKITAAGFDFRHNTLEDYLNL